MNDKDAIKPDNLTKIEGIGQKFATALNHVGIIQYAQLAQFTADELSQTLLSQADLKVPAKRIENNNWLEQAKILAQELEKESKALTKESEPASIQDEVDNHQDWREHAGFMIFFGYEKAIEGNRNWQTRVYHNESGDQIELPGTNPDDWLNWILNKAQLPTILLQALSEELPTSVEEIVEIDEMLEAQLEILDVKVSEIAASEAVPETHLLSEVHFQLSGADAEKLIAQHKAPKLLVDVQGFDPDTGVLEFKKSCELSLQADVYEYTSHLETPFPEKDGIFKLLHNISLDLPAGELKAHYEGRPLQVNP